MIGFTMDGRQRKKLGRTAGTRMTNWTSALGLLLCVTAVSQARGNPSLQAKIRAAIPA